MVLIVKLRFSNKYVKTHSKLIVIYERFFFFQLKFEVENTILYDELVSEKTDLLNFLRSELKNFSITIKFNVTKKISEPIHNSPEEKLRNFKRKNNFINDLISKLNLDTT